MTSAFVGALMLAVLSTAADYVWFLNIPAHTPVAGGTHGAILFAVLGGYLGGRRGKVLTGIAGGLVSGLLAALSFYALAPFGGYPMMLVAWLLLWILLAALQLQLGKRLTVAAAVRHGILIALVAGVGFGAVLFALYGSWPPPAFPYMKHFAAWTLAYLPGLWLLLRLPASE